MKKANFYAYPKKHPINYCKHVIVFRVFAAPYPF